MKKLPLLIVCLLVCLFANNAQAQDVSTASESVKKISKVNVEKWRNSLILNVKQSDKMLDQVIKYEMNKSSIFKADTDMDTKNNDLAVLEEAHHKSMEEILTPKQLEKYLKQISEIKATSN